MSSFNDPKLAISRVYTRTGDKGMTRLVGGQKLPKNHLRIEAYGTVDELNAVVGLCRVSTEAVAKDSKALTWLGDVLGRVQHELFNLGSLLATLPEDIHPKQAQVNAEDVAWLEAAMDSCNGELPNLRSFVLPGGHRLNAELHLARTVCRRAERLVVALAADETVNAHGISYLNRLSDAFFVWSRWVSLKLNADEILWDPNATRPPTAPNP